MGAAILSGCIAPPPARGILIVSMDTTRFDRTSLGGARDTTPNLAALARQGTRFEHAYAVANESVTSHAALFTGRYPSEVAVADYATFAIPDGTPTLASALAAFGHATAAFTGGGHVVSDFGMHQGFERFESVQGDHTFGSFFDTVPSALAWIHARDTPWFAFVHGYDAHTPYLQRGPFEHPWGDEGATGRIEHIVADDIALEQLRGNLWFPDRTPGDFTHAVGRDILATDFYWHAVEPQPGERVEVLSAGEIAHLRDHYDSGLHYADVWLGQLLAGIDLEHTLVIVLSDHGEDLLEHGFVNHRAGLWDSTLHVPLVVAGPGIPAGEVVQEPVDLRSVVPTVLAWAGVPPLAGANAPDLRAKQTPRPVFAEGTLDELSVRTPDGDRLVLHDVGLAKGAPGLRGHPLTMGAASRYREPDSEPQPLSSDRSAVDLREVLAQWRDILVPATQAGAPVSAALRAELDARGYWVPEAAGGSETELPSPGSRDGDAVERGSAVERSTSGNTDP